MGGLLLVLKSGRGGGFISLLYLLTHVYDTFFSMCQLLCNKNEKEKSART